MALGIGTVLFILVATGMAVAVASAKKASTDENWNAASAAAYAGIADYQSKLLGDEDYYQYGNPDSPFNPSGSSSVVLPSEAAANPAFNLGADEPWAHVDGSDETASYRYEVDNSEFKTTGALRLRATGRVGDSTRSLIITLRKKSLLEYVYITNYEVQDPINTSLNALQRDACARYEYQGRAARCGGDLRFSSNDVFDGPVHSNDTMKICGAAFLAPTTTAYKARDGSNFKGCNPNSDGLGTRWYDSKKVVATRVIDLPVSNKGLRKETRAFEPGVANPGCLYTGPTTVTFTGDTMIVRSPWTKFTNVKADGAGHNLGHCGTPGPQAGGLGSAEGARVPIPTQNVIYVQDVPTTAGNANTWAASTFPDSISCAVGNGLGYPYRPAAADILSERWELDNNGPGGKAPYSCRAGDVFVKGTIDARLTLAAEKNIWVVGDITYTSPDAPENNVLGLVAGATVYVWNPVGKSCNAVNAAGACTSWNKDKDVIAPNGDIDKNKAASAPAGRIIHAAIMSVSNSFAVQNNRTGTTRGKLRIYGAIIQNFRGAVGYNGKINSVPTIAGYTKDYNYDSRLRYSPPPKFLSPLAATFNIAEFAETAPAFTASGRLVDSAP